MIFEDSSSLSTYIVEKNNVKDSGVVVVDHMKFQNYASFTEWSFWLGPAMKFPKTANDDNRVIFEKRIDRFYRNFYSK